MDGLGLAFYAEVADFAVDELATGEGFDAFADEAVGVELFGGGFEAGGEVHAVAEDGEFAALGVADFAGDDAAVVDADADADGDAAAGPGNVDDVPADSGDGGISSGVAVAVHGADRGAGDCADSVELVPVEGLSEVADSDVP